MARRQFAGIGDIRLLPSCTNVNAPTAAEITAGTRLTKQMTRDGLKRPSSGNTSDTSDASSLFNSQDIGTYGGDAMEYKGYRESKVADDVAWTTLARGVSAFIAVTDYGWAQSGTTGLGASTGTPTTGDRCQIYPVTVISREMMDTAENETPKFVAKLAITGDPAQDAVVA